MQRSQVAAVHADETGTRIESPIEFSGIVHFDEGCEPEGPRTFSQAPECGLFQRRDDQQDGIRPGRPCFVELGTHRR